MKDKEKLMYVVCVNNSNVSFMISKCIYVLVCIKINNKHESDLYFKAST